MKLVSVTRSICQKHKICVVVLGDTGNTRRHAETCSVCNKPGNGHLPMNVCRCQVKGWSLAVMLIRTVSAELVNGTPAEHSSHPVCHPCSSSLVASVVMSCALWGVFLWLEVDKVYTVHIVTLCLL